MRASSATSFGLGLVLGLVGLAFANPTTVGRWLKLDNATTAQRGAAAALNAGAIIFTTDDTTCSSVGSFQISNGVTWAPICTSDGGPTALSLAAVGSSPNANAATLSAANALNLEPASATQPGVLTAIDQALAGIKTLDGGLRIFAPSSAVAALQVDTTGSNSVAISTGDGDYLCFGSTTNNGNTCFHNATVGPFASVGSGGIVGGFGFYADGHPLGISTARVFSTNTTLVRPSFGDGSTANVMAYLADVAPRSIGSANVGNVGAGEDTLQTYTMPASTWTSSTRSMQYKAAGSTANNANAKTLKLYFGSATLLTATLPTLTAARFDCGWDGARTGTSAQRITGACSVTDTGTNLIAFDYSFLADTTETETSTIVIKATGTATSDNDIVQNTSFVQLF